MEGQAHSPVGVTLSTIVVVLLMLLAWTLIRRSDVGLLAALHLRILWVALDVYLGGLSHLALDGFNDTPQWWAWPFATEEFRWPIRASVKRIDAPVSLALTVVVALLAWHVGHLSVMHLIRAAK